jgi:hypothetical protein
MTITTRNQLVAEYATKQTLIYNKAAITTAANSVQYSSWRLTGVPAQGAVPTTAALCTKATTGAFTFDSAPTGLASYISEAELTLNYSAGNSFSSTIELHDRLAHMGGLSGIVTTAQTAGVNLLTLAPSAARIGASNYSDVSWWLEWYTSTGATGATFTCGVTMDDGTTSTVAIVLGASVGAGRMFPIIATVPDRYIRSVDTVTLSATTGTAGNFGVTATRQRTCIGIGETSVPIYGGYEMTGFPSIENDACLFVIGTPSIGNTNPINGKFTLVQG